MSAVRDAILLPKGYQQLAVAAAAVALTVPAGTKYALLKPDAAIDIRWRDDGVDPTAAIGMILNAADEFWYTGDVRKIRFISAGAATSLNIAYYS